MPSDTIWICLSAVGFVIAFSSMAAARLQRKSWDWPSFSARITRVYGPQVKEEKDSETGRVSYSTEIELAYSYELAGKTRTGTEKRSWEGTNPPESELFLDLNPVGKPFLVIANPDDPGDNAYVDGPGHPGEGRSGIVIGATGVAIGLVLVFVHLSWVAPAALAIAGGALAWVVYLNSHYPFGRQSPFDMEVATTANGDPLPHWRDHRRGTR